MVLSWLLFCVACLAVAGLEALCFKRLREISPSTYETIGRPAVFFHGIRDSSFGYFVRMRYWSQPELMRSRALFSCLSAAYMVSFLFFAILVWELSQGSNSAE